MTIALDNARAFLSLAETQRRLAKEYERPPLNNWNEAARLRDDADWYEERAWMWLDRHEESKEQRNVA